MNNKEIKSEIRKLKKLKLSCKAGTPERINLHKKIKVLKEKIQDTIDVIKEPIIKEILSIRPEYKDVEIDLNKFTIQELEFHLNKIKQGEKDGS